MSEPQTQPLIGSRRLSSLWFFQLFAYGAVLSFMSYYLTTFLGFTGLQTGIILAITALSNVVGPLLSAYVIDRLVHARTIYIAVMLVMAVSSLTLIFVRDFWSVLFAVLFLYLSFGPALNILHSTTFQDMKYRPGGTNRFGAVRVWGTVGWIASGFSATAIWVVSPLILANHTGADLKVGAFLLASLGATLCILIYRTIPKVPLVKQPVTSFLPQQAFAVIKKPIVLSFGIVYTASQLFESFYYFGQGPYLASLNVSAQAIPAVLTVGQVLEIPILFFFALVLKRLGFYSVFCLGVSAQLLRYVLFMTGSPALGIVALALNGVVFACVLNAITMFIDKHADDKDRNGVHQLVGLFFNGSSVLLGNLLSGVVFDSLDKNHINFSQFWFLPLVGSLLVFVFVLFFLRKVTRASPFNREKAT